MTDEEWGLVYEPGRYLQVWDTESGNIIMERAWDPSFDQGAALNLAEVSLGEVSQIAEKIHLMDNEALDALHELADRLMRRSWWVKCCIYSEAQRRYPTLGSQKDAFTAIGRRFGVSPSTVRRGLLVYDFFRDKDLDAYTLDEKGWYEVALDEGGREKAEELLNMAQEKRDSGVYSIAQFRRDIHERGEGPNMDLIAKYDPVIAWARGYWMCAAPKGLPGWGATPNAALNNWVKVVQAKENLDEPARA